MNTPDELIYFLIACTWWVLRYLSNIITKKIEFILSEFIVWVITSWLIGILAWRIAPQATENLNLQHAIIYVAGMLSIEIIKIIVHKVPSLISKKIDDAK